MFCRGRIRNVFNRGGSDSKCPTSCGNIEANDGACTAELPGSLGANSSPKWHRPLQENMKDQETQQRFIQLRSQGWSFNRIAEELNVARGTLINWSRKFQFEIQNLRAIELEALRENLVATAEIRANALAKELRRIQEELQKRDLSKVSTGRLYSLAESFERKILQETGTTRFTCPVDDIPNDEYHEQVQHWKG